VKFPVRLETVELLLQSHPELIMNSVSGKTNWIYFLPPSLIWFYVFLSKTNTHTHTRKETKLSRVGKMLFKWFLFFCRSSDDVMEILLSRFCLLDEMPLYIKHFFIGLDFVKVLSVLPALVVLFLYYFLKRNKLLLFIIFLFDTFFTYITPFFLYPHSTLSLLSFGVSIQFIWPPFSPPADIWYPLRWIRLRGTSNSRSEQTPLIVSPDPVAHYGTT
jgi:hypothetical protein